MENSLAYLIRENVDKLAEKHGLNSVTFAKKVGLDQKTMYNLMNPDKTSNLPTTRTLDAIRKAFKIDFWTLVFPDMPLDLMTDTRATESIKLLAKCSPDNRDKIFSQIRDIARLDELDRDQQQ